MNFNEIGACGKQGTFTSTEFGAGKEKNYYENRELGA